MQGILGRDAESALVAGFIESVPSGASALLLTGEPGIGKTALLRAAMQAAAARSYRVLTCQPGESETQLLFTALIDLFEDVLDEALPRLPEPQRGLSRWHSYGRGPRRTRRTGRRSHLRYSGSSDPSPGTNQWSWPWTTSSGSTPRRRGSSNSSSGGWNHCDSASP
jgi:hypothetical protein